MEPPKGELGTKKDFVIYRLQTLKTEIFSREIRKKNR